MPSVEFVIKNIHTGKYVHNNETHNINDDSGVRLHDGHQYDYIHYVFEPVDGIWGNIRQTTSGKVWNPLRGPGTSKTKGTKIILHRDRPRWALWAFDQVNDHIIHRDGFFVHHDGGRDPYAKNRVDLNLCAEIHEGMKWKLVNPNNTSEEVYPYGSAKIAGDWKLVASVDNALVTQTLAYRYKTGKSHTDSTSDSFQFAWETSVSAGFSFAQMSTSTSLTSQIEKSSSDTWTKEVEFSNTIQVEPGESVAVWQKTFIGTQHDHKAVFQSNIFEHTKNVDVKPED